MDIGSLSISYQDNFPQLAILRLVFEHLKFTQSLKALHLHIFSGEYFPPRSSDPIYFGTAKRKRSAEYYDLKWRPVKHPLAKITSLRSLSVQGHPGTGEIEEAVVKIFEEIKALAVREGKFICTYEENSNREDRLFYKIQIDIPFKVIS